MCRDLIPRHQGYEGQAAVIQIMALALITVALAAYTLIAMKWWLENIYKLPKRLTALLCIPVVIFVIAAPLFLLGYLMNDVHIVKNLDSTGRFVFLMAWIAPGVLYNIIRQIQRDKMRK